MMRYWLLTTEFPPFYGGGISTYCAITARMLQENGHNVTVFLPDFSVSGVKETDYEGIRMIRFVPRQTDAHQFLGYNAYLSYEFAEVVKRNILREGKPDVIEAHEYQGIAYYIQQFKWQRIQPFADLNIIVTCHSPSFICLEYNQVPIYKFPDYWTGEMEKATIKGADLVLFPSRYLIKEMENRLSLKDVNSFVVPNPFDESTFSCAATALIEPNTIICFGKLAPLKGTFELLRYFDALWESGTDLKLYIVGGTDYFFHPEGKTMYDLVLAKYKSHIDSGRLVLTGNRSPEECSTYLAKAALVVVPSLFDNFPYTVLEAMAMGKIVLASKQGGHTEMITHGENGFLFDHYTEGDFYKQLNTALSLEPGISKKISEAAKETVSKTFHPHVIYPLKMRLIEDLLNGNTDRRTYPFVNKIEESPNNSETAITATENLLSVVIPFYNMGSYVEETVQSVYASDYKNIEVIVVDDGSTEAASIAVLELLQHKYPIRIIRRRNAGLPATRNFGATIATGEYIAFLDSDDTVEPTYYSNAIAILQQYKNVHFVGSWLLYFGEGKGTWPTFNPEPPYMLIHNPINSSAIVLKRHTFVNYGANCTELVYGMEDWESVINMVSKGYRGVVIPQKLFNYRVRKGSMSQSFTREKQLYLLKVIAQRHRVFYAAYGADVMQLLNSNGSSLYFDNPTFEVVHFAPSEKLAALKNRLKEHIKRNKLLRKMAYVIFKKLKT
jgi:glycosyltransferase involved in cell wall biosynthesis